MFGDSGEVSRSTFEEVRKRLTWVGRLSRYCEEEQRRRSSKSSTNPSLHGQNPILLPSVVLPSKAPVRLFDRPNGSCQASRTDRPQSDRASPFRARPSLYLGTRERTQNLFIFPWRLRNIEDNELRRCGCGRLLPMSERESRST